MGDWTGGFPSIVADGIEAFMSSPGALSEKNGGAIEKEFFRESTNELRAGNSLLTG
jgi:hypothetical protein